MTNVACETKLRLVVRSSLHPCPENWVAIGLAVVYYAHLFSAGIKCRHCTNINWCITLMLKEAKGGLANLAKSYEKKERMGFTSLPTA